MAKTNKQIGQGATVTVAEGEFKAARRAWVKEIKTMKQEGWRESRRFFSHESATVYFTQADGAVATVALHGAA